MRVPVLVVLPATDPLRNAAVASIMEKASAAPLTSAALPQGIELDPTFPPVAIGTGRPQDVSVAGFEAAVSESFTVRGFIETDAPDEIPEEVGGALAVSGADIVFAAGNCGAQCADGRCQSRTTGTIMGASASDSVLTLAGCDTNDQRVGYSSQGPSISGMFQQKPDLTAYTHFVGSEAYGPGSPDSGTSTSCPIAAGCVAALRTRLSPGTTPPASLFAQLNATARVVGGAAGWNGDYGHGIIDPLAAATTLGL